MYIDNVMMQIYGVELYSLLALLEVVDLLVRFRFRRLNVFGLSRRIVSTAKSIKENGSVTLISGRICEAVKRAGPLTE